MDLGVTQNLVKTAQQAYQTHWEKMAKSRHFPIYHYVPGNWINDPKLFYWQGEYHIFFQHNPNGSFWGTMHWGHTVSRDLIHWEPLPIALAPTPDSVDQDGCFTGSVVEFDGIFYMFYTSISNDPSFTQTQSVATSRDLISWIKSANNPLAMAKPAPYADCWRDPCVWKEGETWFMAIGGEKPDEQGGVVFLYTSQDLTNWCYIGLLCEGSSQEVMALSDKVRSYKFHECPDFFPLADKHVLLTTQAPHTYWQVGNYADQKFEREQFGIIDGGGFCSAKTLEDDKGRRIAWGFLWPHWGWITAQGPEQEEAGYSGVLSLPRQLSVLPDNRLGIEPVEELKQLRGKHTRLQDLTLEAQSDPRSVLLEGVTGDALELLVEFEPASAEVFGISVRCSTDFEEKVDIIYDRRVQKLVDSPLELGADEGLTLRVYLDRSIIEAFADSRACQTMLTYPEREDAIYLALYAQNGQVRVKSIDVWEMNPMI